MLPGRISFANPVQPDSVDPENWEDTVRFGLGVDYLVSDDWTLRAGVAYDPTPVQDEFRTARIPDGDRTWLAFGFSYEPSANLSLDFSYVYIFFDDSTINKSTELRGTLRGNYESQVDIIGLQLSWQF